MKPETTKLKPVVMHKPAPETSSPPVPESQVPKEQTPLPSCLEENDLLKLQLQIARLGLTKQAVENAQLRLELAQTQAEAATGELQLFQRYIAEKYELKDGESYNYTTGEFKRLEASPQESAAAGGSVEKTQ